MNGVKDKIWFLREGLFAKYVIALVGLVVFVLAVNGAMETWISYRGIKTTLTDGMSEKAEATERQIEQSMADLERQISWVTRAYSNTIEVRRADYQQLLNQVPWVSQLSLISGQGREPLRLSRRTASPMAATWISPAMSPSSKPAARGTSFAPAYFRDERPFMSIAVSHSDSNVGITVAEIDLALPLGLPRRRPGRQGGLRLCRRRQGPGAGEFVEGPGGRQGSLGPAAGRRRTDAGGAPLSAGTDADGHSVLTTASAVPKLGWNVFFEQPTAQALTPIRDQLVRIALLIALGLVVAIIAGTVMARRMLVPITALRAGARRLGAGEFGHRIDVQTADELEELANQFNSMAGQLAETYSDLEWKVKERTRDLAQSINELKVLEEVGRAVSSSLDLNAVLPTVAARALEITHADAVLIYGYDAANHQFNLTEAIGIDKIGRGRPSRHRRGRQPARRGRRSGRADRDPAISTRRPIIRCATWRSRPASIRCWWCRWSTSRACWDRWWCCARTPANFPHNLIGLMKTFAHQSVLAMRNARLFTEVDHKSRELETAQLHRAPAGRQAAGADRPAQGLEQVAGGAGRDAARRNRAHPPARTFPGAAGGATDRLLRRP